MASGDPLPAQHHVFRACGRGFDGEVVTAAAFQLRECDKDRLSVDWIECAYAPQEDQTVEGSLSRLKKSGIRPQRIVKLNVGDIRTINHKGQGLEVIQAHSKTNKCHSAIAGMTYNENNFETENILAYLANSRGKPFDLI